MVYRKEAEMWEKQTNQKYDEAEQKSQAWMKAKDEAQSHKRMWHNYWQQAMVSAISCVIVTMIGTTFSGDERSSLSFISFTRSTWVLDRPSRPS